jgi:hypothetical protein
MVRFKCSVGRRRGGDLLAVVSPSRGVLDEFSVLDSPGGEAEDDGFDAAASVCELGSSLGDSLAPGILDVVGESAVSSSISGLLVLGINCFSNTLSADSSAGPLSGPVSWGSAYGRFPAPTSCARASKSSIFWVSTSPVARAWALAMPALDVMDQPILSFIKSIDRLSMFCRLCIKSSD